MSTLPAELDRLYLARGRNIQSLHGAEPGLIAPDGSVRAMVLELARPADWTLLSSVWRGVQTDLELPAPAIAVSGVDGYQLWFSLAEPVSVAQAGAFLEFWFFINFTVIFCSLRDNPVFQSYQNQYERHRVV